MGEPFFFFFSYANLRECESSWVDVSELEEMALPREYSGQIFLSWGQEDQWEEDRVKQKQGDIAAVLRKSLGRITKAD